MIRTSKHILKYQNSLKNQQLQKLFIDFKELTELYINQILNKELPLQTNLSSKLLQSSKSIKHSQYKQIAYKTAVENIKSVLVKVKNQVFKRYKSLYFKCSKNPTKRQKFLAMRFGQLKINYLKRIKIDMKNLSINIDVRLFDFKEVQGEFNEFIHLRLPYFQEEKKRSISINLPIKHHRQSLKFKNNGWKRKNTIQLQMKDEKIFLNLFWEKENVTKIENKDKVIGIDLGYKKMITTSTNKVYGKEMFDLYQKISKKKQGSKNFKQLLTHRTNLTNFYTKQFLKEENPDIIVIEDLNNVKHKSKIHTKTMNKMQRWSYRTVIQKIKNLSEEEGFQIILVAPEYTSQKCSKCGFICKENRQGELYKCSCGNILDADYNAALNILHRGEYSPSTTNKIEF